MNRITMKDALSKIFHFFIGYKEKPESEAEAEALDNSHIQKEIDENNITCGKCGSKLQLLNVARNDFINFYIYTCHKCDVIIEYHFSKENKLLKVVYLFDTFKPNEVIESENEGLISYEKFSLGRLWTICGNLCYPALIKTDFPDESKTTRIFLKVNNPNPEKLEGYMISDQHVVGEIQLTNLQVKSLYYNPYLARLPKPDYLYLAIPTTYCTSVESVLEIRFRYETTDISNEIIIHKLNIIKDNIHQCSGFEIYIKFITHGCPKEKKISTVLKKIDFRSILLEEDIHTAKGYGIQVYHLTHHTLSAITRNEVDFESRNGLYESVIEFFAIYDKTNS